MKLYSLVILTGLFLFFDSKLSAQDIDTPHIVVPQKTRKGYNSDPFELFLIKGVFNSHNIDYKALFAIPKDEAHFIALALVFDMRGKIDTIYVSRKVSANIQSFLKTPIRIDTARTIKNLDTLMYAGKVVIQPIMLLKAGAENLSFLKSFQNDLPHLWPELKEKDRLKPLILRQPFINWFFPPVH